MLNITPHPDQSFSPLPDDGNTDGLDDTPVAATSSQQVVQGEQANMDAYLLLNTDIELKADPPLLDYTQTDPRRLDGMDVGLIEAYRACKRIKHYLEHLPQTPDQAIMDMWMDIWSDLDDVNMMPQEPSEKQDVIEID